MVRLTDRPDMTIAVYRGRKITTQRQQQQKPVTFCGPRFRYVKLNLIYACIYFCLSFPTTEVLCHIPEKKTVIKGEWMLPPYASVALTLNL